MDCFRESIKDAFDKISSNRVVPIQVHQQDIHMSHRQN